MGRPCMDGWAATLAVSGRHLLRNNICVPVWRAGPSSWRPPIMMEDQPANSTRRRGGRTLPLPSLLPCCRRILSGTKGLPGSFQPHGLIDSVSVSVSVSESALVSAFIILGDTGASIRYSEGCIRPGARSLLFLNSSDFGLSTLNPGVCAQP